MNGQRLLEVASESIRFVFFAERAFPAGSGARKKRYVIDSVRPLLEVPQSPSLSELGDLNEILETVGELVSLVVKLFNMFGIFRRSRRRDDERNDIEPET